MTADSAQPTGNQIWPLRLLCLLTLIGAGVSGLNSPLLSDRNTSKPGITLWLDVPAATWVLLGVAGLCALLLYAPWVRYLSRGSTAPNDVTEIKRMLSDFSSGNSRLTTLVSDVSETKRQLADLPGEKDKFTTLIGDVADIKQLLTDSARPRAGIDPTPTVDAMDQLGTDAEKIHIAYGPLLMTLLTLQSIAGDLTALKTALGDAARSDGGTILARLASIESKLPPSP